MTTGGDPFDLTDETPVYVISVAAQLSGLHPQTLRQYDRMGLVQPGRTPGRGRRYSMRDIQMLREIQRLSQDEGINLAGIKRILELDRMVTELRTHMVHLQNELAAARNAVARRGRHDPPPRQAAGPGREVAVRRTSVVVWQPDPFHTLHGDQD
jgi:MerR family transcriptional regulator, heat shock protein HspR